MKSFEYNGGSYFMCKYVDGKGQVRSYQDMMKEAGYTLNLKKGLIVMIKDRVGEVNRANNGMLMKIVAYRSCRSIDVQFENGVTVYNKIYWDFKRGVIGLPRQDRTGEVRRANNGMLMKVIAYRSAQDMDIQFENGSIAYNKSYDNFKKGKIDYPKVNDRVGEVNRANNGMLMKIVAYRSSKDIDIRFEDGTLVCNKAYNSFRAGKISNPSIYSSRIGEINRANNGLLMKIIAYRNTEDLDVQFEDGKIVKNRAYKSFKRGEILHPMISKMVGKSVSNKNFYGFTDIRKSFEYNGMVYYLCKDLQGKGQMYTLQKMMELAGVKPAF